MLRQPYIDMQSVYDKWQKQNKDHMEALCTIFAIFLWI
jgi:hypothetical protein